ncbi:MAG: LLM class F420-dependent oxidoreductase [Dehalococcoidia bacterium]|nr:LLM class F420-dependent oxidoreductase [Dehalococcoidia bacterium]HCV00504.1 LLM class F420-dependent oxidoreductase [Dehalococcoidia bacterium]|tara:strand:+ start:12259 stop:13134 length:876 start_codon:yes stop_codon:yes gene_type:complete
MHTGIHVANFTWQGGPAEMGPRLAELGVVSEQVGCSRLSFMDHLFQIGWIGTPELDMLEGYTALGFVAGHTSTIRLGLLVTGVTYRHPGVLAKQISTLDVLSGGRAWLGIGAAWNEQEHLGLGVPFPPLGERFERLEEAVQICLQMWSDENGSFQGKHFQLAETLNVPQSISRPHPELLIGGRGERKTLRLVARYADACNLTSSEVEEIRHKLEVLRAHCEREGTDYNAIEKTVAWTGPPLDSADERARFLDRAAEFAAEGVTTVTITPYGQDPVAEVKSWEPLIQRLSDL